MDITKHDNGENYLKVINRKGVTNVYLLEANDNAERINDRIREIYANVNKSNLCFYATSFEDIVIKSQELTKNILVPRSVPVGLYREDALFKGIFVGVSSTSEYKKDCKYISVLTNGKKLNGYYDFEKY